jgi:MoaA/NifB/PqqE/SkfB family radical SAM enzyme
MGLLDLARFMGYARPFFAWQIELTTRCSLRCRMCIREGAVNWQGRDMKLEDFRGLSPYFSNVETIVLQGWGEPLLYTNLIEAVRIAREKGARAGFVTSGANIEREFTSELIDAGTDFIGFSLAGATAKTHNAIRLNSDFEVLLGTIRFFNEVKERKKLDKPRLHIVYLMLKDNMADVPVLVDLAKSAGINDIILTNLIHITNKWQEEQRIFSCTDPPPKDFEALLRVAETEAKKFKVNLRFPALRPADVPVCEENPLKNIYISSEGEVSPCVYLSPPVPSPFKRVYCGNTCETEKASFGNIFREPFGKVWSNHAYAEFRSCFKKRLKKHKGLSPADTNREPPTGCRTCHKILGL